MGESQHRPPCLLTHTQRRNLIKRQRPVRVDSLILTYCGILLNGYDKTSRIECIITMALNSRIVPAPQGQRMRKTLNSRNKTVDSWLGLK